jgi:hypothetical protein
VEDMEGRSGRKRKEEELMTGKTSETREKTF